MWYSEIFHWNQTQFPTQSGTADETAQTALGKQPANILPDEILVRIIYVTLVNWEEIFYCRKYTLLHKNIPWLTLLKTREISQFNVLYKNNLLTFHKTTLNAQLEKFC